MLKKYFIGFILILSISFALAFLINVPNTNVVLSQSKESLTNKSNRNLSLYEQGKTYDFGWANLKLVAQNATSLDSICGNNGQSNAAQK